MRVITPDPLLPVSGGLGPTAPATEKRGELTVRAFVDSAVPGTYQVEMIPTRKQIKEGLSELRIWVDEETLFLRRMRMTFASGDTKTFVLGKVQLDQPIAPGTFEAPETRTVTR